MTENDKYYTGHQLQSLLNDFGFSVPCLSRFIAQRIYEQRIPNGMNVNRQYANDILLRFKILDMVTTDRVESQVMHAIGDLSNEIDENVDRQISLFLENEIKAFRTVIFDNAEDFDTFAMPYNAIYSMQAFNVLQRRVAYEAGLHGIHTQSIRFDAKSYLDYLSANNYLLNELKKSNESQVFAWGGRV